MSIPRLGLVALLFTAGACSHVPLASMVKLSGVDPLKTDPATVRAAIKLPSGLRLRSTVLQLTMRGGNGESTQRTFRLQESAEATETAARDIGPKPGERVSAWKIAPADLASVSAFWREMSAAPKGTRSLKVLVMEACRGGELPGGAIPLSSYLQTPELGSYVPLAVDVDLREVAKDNPDLKIVPCAGSAPDGA